MRSTISLFSAIAFALVCTVPAAEASYDVHPWEFRQRRPIERRTLATDYADLEEYYDQSPHRSSTHALHPLNRRRYYNLRPYIYVGERGIHGLLPLNKIYEYNRDTHRRSRIEIGGPAKGSECLNYSFNRPNYRVPPFGYKCQD
ncbi:hypothetical protein FJZ27_00285 [Candidatus Peribacteria bacterium]|nr:hypothetical protein [Candidatus Peribacteria bacterium]